MWEVDDVLEKMGREPNEEVLVRWKGSEWEGHDSWVCLKENPELRRFLKRNRGNDGLSVVKKKVKTEAGFGDPELHYLAQEIRRALGFPKPTVDGNIGLNTRTTVEVPFSKRAFAQHFRSNPVF